MSGSAPPDESGVWKLISRFFPGLQALALMDQAVVSGTSFLTTVFIARWANPAQLGVYAIGASLLACLVAAQEALIVLPYSIQQDRGMGTAAQRAGASLALNGVFSGASLGALLFGGIALWGLGAHSELMAMTLVLAGVVPLALMREYARRLAFTELHVVRALALDVLVAAIQLGVLGWLGWSGRVSAITACAAVGAACGVAFIAWLVLARHTLAVRLEHLLPTLRYRWTLGKWLLLSRVTVQVQTYTTYWLLIIFAGAAVTGVYAACMSIVAIANPLVFGLGNILMPRSVRAYKDGGGPVLIQQAVQDALLLGAVMIAFCIAVLFAGEHLMQLFYNGKEFEGHLQTLTILALALSMTAAGLPASNALAAMERLRPIVAIQFFAAVVTAVLVFSLMGPWGLLGAAYGVMAGNAINCVGRWAVFIALVPKSWDPAAIVRVLREYTEVSDERDWMISRLGDGDHATAYMIRAEDQKPICPAIENVVIKLYKAGTTLTPAMVQAQFDALSELCATLNSHSANGWTISAPQALYLCQSPTALVMTMARGKQVGSGLGRGNEATPETLRGAAGALAAAMEKMWSRGMIHGDLGLQNILLDVQSKEISLIDAGTFESCAVCANRKFEPAVLDFAHLLSALAIDISDMTSNQAVRIRKQIFVDTLLAAIIENRGPDREKRRFLDAVRECAQAHLDDILHPSMSVRGVWHWFIKHLAANRVAYMLHGLKPEGDIDAESERMEGDRSVDVIAPIRM